MPAARVQAGLLQRLLTLALLAAIAAEMLLRGTADLPAAARGLVYACCILLAAFTLRPHAHGRANPPWQQLLGLAAGAAGACLLLTSLRCGMPVSQGLWLAAGVFAILVLVLAGVFLAETLGATPASAAALILTLAVLAAAAPLWLGPLAAARAQSGLGQLAVHISPLSHLAALIELDYLRGAWFYRHSPLGGMRYEYAGAAVVLPAYLLTAAVLLMLTRRLAPGPGETASAPPLSTLKHKDALI